MIYYLRNYHLITENSGEKDMDSQEAVSVEWSRTHYMQTPEKREGDDRRKNYCFIANDRRSGIACRRKEKMREMERRIALKKVTFLPEYAII